MSSPSHLLALQVIGSLPPPPTPPHPTPLPGLGFYFVFLYLWLYLVFEDASGEDGQVKTQFSLGVRFALHSVKVLFPTWAWTYVY